MTDAPRCTRCFKPTEPGDRCDECDHVLSWRCTHCRSKAVNQAPHRCKAGDSRTAAVPHTAGSSNGQPTLSESVPDFVLESPSAETVENARPRVREVSFLSDGTIMGVLAGLPGEENLGLAWLVALEGLLAAGKIDLDTVVCYPGGRPYVTVGTLVREGKLRDASLASQAPGELRP